VPIYEYECSTCGAHFDRKQNFHEEPVAICPKCQGKARRVFHAVPIIFKGSGFYVTDSRKGGITEPTGKGKTPSKKKEKAKKSEGTPAKSN